MFEHYFRRRHVRRRLEANVLAESLAGLVEHLARRQHTRLAIQSYVQAVEHFGRWLQRTGRAVADVDAAIVQRFLTRHLPHCQCPLPCARSVPTLRAALHQLLHVLPRPAAVAVPPLTPIDDEVLAFDAHLRDTCGLTPATRGYYGRYVRELLVARFGPGPVDLATLTLDDLIAFVTSRAAHLTPGSANTVTTGVRSFLRYLQLRGVGDSRWAAAVPHAACWRLATLPRVLGDEQLHAFLAGFDRAHPTGQRGYAIALCFTRLGLRVGDVARMTLDDLDWRARTLTLSPGKARRADRHPLPAPVAAALAAYLQHGRPPTAAREIFVHHRAPRGGPLGPSGVRSAMRQAYHDSGLDPHITGTHVLRHTVATRLLQAGASMKEIADVLRHRSLDTSAIYAKVDLATLTTVALPWPEGPS